MATGTHDSPGTKRLETSTTARRVAPNALISVFLVAFPAVIFYGILFKKAINLPLEDDYESLLDFLNHFVKLSSISAKASYFVAAQFNEYKLFFGHAVALLQFAILGRADMRVLCALGNASVLLMGILLWKIFLPGNGNVATRLGFFIPASFLLFQLGYVETLNWAMPSLQNLPVLLFSFGTIYFLVRPSRKAFCAALIWFVLAVAASGNGLLMVPIGLMILVLKRQYARIAGWLAASAACVGAYAYHYNLLSSQSRLHQSILSTLLRPRPVYVITFIGNAAAYQPLGRYHPLEVVMSLLLGLLLCGIFFFFARRGYPRRNPVVCYCVLFLLMSAVGVAGLRSDFGISQSLDSRYAIYSDLLVIFAWFAIVEEFLRYQDVPLHRSKIFLIAVVGSALFCLRLDTWGWLYLGQRNQKVTLGMTAYERSASHAGPVLPLPNQNARFKELDRAAPLILRESIRLGVYQPPSL